MEGRNRKAHIGHSKDYKRTEYEKEKGMIFNYISSILLIDLMPSDEESIKSRLEMEVNKSLLESSEINNIMASNCFTQLAFFRIYYNLTARGRQETSRRFDNYCKSQ